MAPPPWTGWSRSRSGASRSRLPPPRASGATTASTSSTPPATSTSRPRWSAASACSTAPSRCSVPSAGSSPSRRRCGARPTVIAFRGIAFVNKMDRVGADFFGVVEQMKRKLRAEPGAGADPAGQRGDVPGHHRPDREVAPTSSSDESLGAEFERSRDAGRRARSRREHWREKLLEAVAEHDEELLERYLAGEALSPGGDAGGAARPGPGAPDHPGRSAARAFRNKGVQQLLDAVVDFLPSPLDVPPIEGHTPSGEPDERAADDDAPFAALAFKIMTDPFVGQLTFLRVYSGSLATGTTRCSMPAAATRSESAGS